MSERFILDNDIGIITDTLKEVSYQLDNFNDCEKLIKLLNDMYDYCEMDDEKKVLTCRLCGYTNNIKEGFKRSYL